MQRLFDTVEPLGRPGHWSEHVQRLKQVAGSLGIDDDENVDRGLERFWNALDDQAAVFETAEASRLVPFREFVKVVEALAQEHGEIETQGAGGTICVATIEEATGARGRFVVLANLSEGTFPTREALESADDPATVGRAYARELSRFLRVIGSASDEVVLAYPTRDEKGQEILAAGFLDDLKRRFDGTVEEHGRFDPALLEHADLAIAPADARARALALAFIEHDPRDLARLATDPWHRRHLKGTATALSVTACRLDPREFSSYDGRLTDAGHALASRFGPSYPFSPSQLESFLTCPFQFFFKYVLKLKPVDDRDELDENFIARGDRIHKLLEDYERLKLAQGDAPIAVEEFMTQTLMMVDLTVDSESDPGLNEIERRRVQETFRRYVRQAHTYATLPKEPSSRPAHLEVAFGDEHEENPHPCVVIGEGADAVRVQGKIDRVDVIVNNDGPSFRVIDYKTGTPPAKKDVTGLLMVQLPLYALAVEKLALAGESASPRDVGYWDLKDKGYSRIDLKDWDALKTRLEAAVIEAVARLRSGLFVVDPRKDDCTRFCDYATACRIGQVRPVGKGSVKPGDRDER